MDRLLNDEELDAAFEGAFDKPVDFDHKPTPDEIFKLQLKAVGNAASTNTIKYIIDWRMEDCTDHRSEDDVVYNYYTKRYNCPQCWQALEKGVM